MVTIKYKVIGADYQTPNINIMTECYNCGQIFSGNIYASNTDWQCVARAARKGMPVCSICGSNIFQKSNYSVWNIGKIEAGLKKQLQEQISEYETERCLPTVKKQLPKIKAVKDLGVGNEIAKKIKSDTASLTVYLQYLVSLEMWSQFLMESIVDIEVEKIVVNKWDVHKNAFKVELEAKKIQDKEKRLLDKIEKMRKTFKSTVWVREVEPVKLVPPDPPTYLPENVPEKPVAPVMKKPGLFNKKTILAENESARQEYEKAYAKYEQELECFENTKKQNISLREKYEDDLRKYEENVKFEDERIKLEKKRLQEEGELRRTQAEKELNEKISAIKEEISELKKSKIEVVENSPIENILNREKEEYLECFKVVSEAKNKLYSINVIYPNYRDVFAITSFYEYFNSERCYEFEGSNGAYNLYESERRSDAVSKYICKLEDVNKNQVLLYREATDMFKNINGLKNSLKEAIKIITAKETEDVKITEKFINDTFEKYIIKNKKFKQEILDLVERALECLSLGK